MLIRMTMTNRYRLYRRGNIYYSHDNIDNTQASLRTTDKNEAHRLLHTKNEAHRQPALTGLHEPASCHGDRLEIPLMSIKTERLVI